MNNQPATPVSRRYTHCVAVVVFLLAVMGANGAAATPEDPAIVGGREADPGEWPWQVALIHADGHPYWDQFCGGSLIDPFWVVTAAHCVEFSSPEELQVLAGIHNLMAPDLDAQRLNVDEIIIHPDFEQARQFDSDIALLRLATPAAFRPASGERLPIAGINLAPSNSGSLAGLMSTVTGWGNRSTSDSDFPSTLHEVEVPITPQSDCEAAYPFILTDNMLCAGLVAGGRDSCQGDSGGPLMVLNRATAQWELAGIVSWGNGCAQPGLPGVYTRVSRFQQWITEKTGVTGEPDFVLTLSPTATNVCAGALVMLEVVVTRRNGFARRVDLGLGGLPWGGGASFNPPSLIATGQSVLSIDTTTLPGGHYNLRVRGASDGLVREADFHLSVAGDLPARPQPIEPALGVVDASAAPRFRWSAVPEARSYHLEVAGDAAFNDVIYAAEVVGTTHVLPIRLAPQTHYYWRVRADNACGVGPFSAVSSLTTGQAYCRAVDLPIPDDDPNGVSDELTLSSAAPLQDMDVFIDIRHTWVFDLKAQLTHVPSGRVVTLFERPGFLGTGCGDSREDIAVTLNDDAPQSVSATCYDSPPIVRGHVAPLEQLAAFNGLTAAGNWRLNVSDTFVIDTGQLVEWCLMPASAASFCEVVTDIPAAECAALQSLFSATDGWRWSRNDGWFATPSACGWFGVECQAGHVTSVRLAGNGLDGLLPPAIGDLSHLQTLNVSDNAALVGPLPEALARLTLDRLAYNDTGLCTPTLPGFTTWLRGIDDLRPSDARCGQMFLPVARR